MGINMRIGKFVVVFGIPWNHANPVFVFIGNRAYIRVKGTILTLSIKLVMLSNSLNSDKHHY